MYNGLGSQNSSLLLFDNNASKTTTMVPADGARAQIGGIIHEKPVLLHAKAFEQKTPERLYKSRAIMQSNAV
ncbi:MAG: hypothetical protein MR855_07390, partial [Collinsella sp.]|nr:hypothetical protein [Collinsella sp.]